MADWQKSLGSFLDGTIQAFAPGWALSRAQARAAAATLSGSFYRGARYSYQDGRATTGRGASADWTLERSWDRRELVDRARQLERDSVIAESLLSRSSEAVVGTGFRPQARTSSTEWNKRAEELWREWAETPSSCDVRGIATFPELQLLGFRSMLRDGDVGAVKLSTGHLRMFESDELASPTGYEANRVDGVDLDEQGRPTNFWIMQSGALAYADRRTVPNHAKVPAEQVIFMARRQRLGQTRGLSALSGVSWLLDQIDGNVESVTVAARMAACFGLVIKRKTRMTGLPTVTGSDGVARRKLRLEPGSMFELDADEDVTQIDPKHPTQDFPQFLRMLGRLVSLGFGLPLEVAFLDFSQTSYASSRGALLQAWKTWRSYQEQVRRFSDAVYAWKIAGWVDSDKLPNRPDALAHRWVMPGWQWLDPEAEIRAALGAVDAGFETRADVAARSGKDLEEIVEQLAREQELFAKAGVDLVRSTLTRDPGIQGSSGEQAPATPSAR